MPCVVLTPKGTTRNANVPAGDTVATVAAIGRILRRATEPELIGTWKWSGLVIHLFGYKTGKTGTENKHELPPPHDTVILFGDAVIVGTKAGIIVPFTTVDYTKFYTDGHGEDLDSDDSESAGEEEGEEDVEVEEEDESSDDSTVASVLPEEEEEEAPAPLKVAAVSKSAKRIGKKITTWYNIPELTPEPYKLTKA